LQDSRDSPLGSSAAAARRAISSDVNPPNFSEASADQIHAALSRLSGDKFVEVREDGEWLAELFPDACTLRIDGQHLILHLRYGERSLVRRVSRLTEQSAERVVLEVMRFGQVKPGRVEFLGIDARKSRNRIVAESFRGRLARLLAENFPDAEVDSLSATPDATHYFSGLYVRGTMKDQGATWAFLAVPPGSNVGTLNGALTYALAWLHWSREHSPNALIAGVRVFAPEEAASELMHQARCLNARARVEVFVIAQDSDRIERCDPADTGNLQSDLIPRWEIEKLLGRGQAALQRIREMAPQSAKLVSAGLELETDEITLRFRGLEFARWAGGGLQIDPNRKRPDIDDSTGGPVEVPACANRDQSLKDSLEELNLRRSPLASDTRHPLYRSAPERWLETLILADPLRLDATLDARFLYSQVPAFAHSHQGIMDLVGVTRKGRMVIIELKVTEEIQLLAQGLRYWMRVKQHLDNGDFSKLGYFPGVELSKQSPLLWLVAPSLHFHPGTEIMMKYVSPEVEISRIGINENWRRGVRVTFRQ